MKKRAFTMVECLVSAGIFSMLLGIGFSLVMLITSALYDGQTENKNRVDFYEVLYYISREIQSAEAIRISHDNKTIFIRQQGDDGFRLSYRFQEGYPTGGLFFQNKKLLAVCARQSSFLLTEGKVEITAAVVKNNTQPNQIPTVMHVSVAPRCMVTTEGETS